VLRPRRRPVVARRAAGGWAPRRRPGHLDAGAWPRQPAVPRSLVRLPTLQRWYGAQARPGPLRLYSTGNAGSYRPARLPDRRRRTMGISGQRAWTPPRVQASPCAAGSASGPRTWPGATAGPTGAAPTSPSRPNRPNLRPARLLRWTAMAAGPSLLLPASPHRHRRRRHPLLWVIPSIYLLTFVVAWAGERPSLQRAGGILAGLTVVSPAPLPSTAGMVLHSPPSPPPLAVHGRLAAERPPLESLTASTPRHVHGWRDRRHHRRAMPLPRSGVPAGSPPAPCGTPTSAESLRRPAVAAVALLAPRRSSHPPPTLTALPGACRSRIALARRCLVWAERGARWRPSSWSGPRSPWASGRGGGAGALLRRPWRLRTATAGLLISGTTVHGAQDPARPGPLTYYAPGSSSPTHCGPTGDGDGRSIGVVGWRGPMAG
jgi:hypothetical protein